MFDKIITAAARELDKNQIPYMIIGGQAVLVHGEPRITKDIDITIGADTDRLSDILNCVKNLGFRTLVDNPDDFVKSTMVLPVKDAKTGIRLDIIFSYSSYERQAIQRAKIVKILDISVKFASIEDVVIQKIVAGRPRDLEDVKSLLAKNPEFDKNYVLHWLKDFGNALNKNMVEIFTALLLEIK